MRGRVLLLALAFGCQDPLPEKPAAPAAPDWSRAIRHQARWDEARHAVVIEVDITPGFHAYTTGEEVGRPLALELDADSPLRADGPPVYPKGVTKTLSTGRSVIVEGRAELVQVVRAREGQPEAREARGKLSYQVCTDEACDRPRSAPFRVTAGGLETGAVQ